MGTSDSSVNGAYGRLAMRIFSRLISACLLACFAAPAFAATGDPIGSAIRVLNDVTGELNSTAHPLATGDGVRQDEAIAAAANSLAELRLDDQSKVAIGAGARLVLDKFVYDPAANNGTISLKLVTGAFRFITGLASKKTYLIKTPTASISVRGTVFDVYVAPDGATYILLHEGAITACTSDGKCARLSNPCGVVRVATGATPAALHGFTRLGETQRPDFAIAFPFVVTPPSIGPDLRFTRTAIERGDCEPAPKKAIERRAENPPPRHQSAVRQSPSSPPVVRYSSEPYAAQPAPVALAARSWGGAYAGVIAGAVWQTSDPYLDCDDFTPGTTVCSTATSFQIPANGYDTKRVAFTGGGELGYNFQFGNIVLGAEADIAYTDINADSRYDQVFTFPPPCACVVVRGSLVRQELNSLSTVRARVGYALGNVLLYGTGGLAVGQVQYKFDLEWPDIAGTASDSKTKLAVGYSAGAGAEIRFGDWSFKTEYLFYDLGEDELSAQFNLGGAPQPFVFRPRFETEGHVLRVGTNYHFD
jgi:opacity protein-like surface antigen